MRLSCSENRFHELCFKEPGRNGGGCRQTFFVEGFWERIIGVVVCWVAKCLSKTSCCSLHFLVPVAAIPQSSTLIPVILVKSRERSLEVKIP